MHIATIWKFRTVQVYSVVPHTNHMTDLSTAAQLVWDAFCEAPICAEVKLASALRAIAENCVPDDSEGHWVYIPHVLAIADELEAQ